MKAIFCFLGVLAFSAGALLREEPMPFVGWITAAFLLVSVVGWGTALRRT